MANLGRKLMWMAVGTATSKVVKRAARRTLHNDAGRPKLPRPVRRKRGMAPALALVVGASALMAFADTLKEQGKEAARAD